MNALPHLLVVDADPENCDLLHTYLSAEGFRVTTARSSRSMRRIMERWTIDLVLLELALPDEDGFTVVRYLREHSEVGIVILTGRSDSVDRILGLEIGADDYLTKPFEMRELLARLKSVLRRIQRPAGPCENPEHYVVSFAGWRLDLAARQLFSPQNRQVVLTAGEYRLLCAFLEHPNRVLSRNDLMELLHHREAGPYDRSIDVQIGRLRRKIETDPEHPKLIRTVRGAGYIFQPELETTS